MIIPTSEILAYMKYGCPHCGNTCLQVITETSSIRTFMKLTTSYEAVLAPGKEEHVEAFCEQCRLRLWVRHSLWEVYPAHLPHRNHNPEWEGDMDARIDGPPEDG